MQLIRNPLPICFLTNLYACLILVSIGTPVCAQSSWRTAADSSAAYVSQKSNVKAYEWGLRAAVVNKPEKEADSLWSAVLTLSRRLPDSLQVSTLVRAGKYFFDQNTIPKARPYLDDAIRLGEMLHLPQYYLQAYLMTARAEIHSDALDKAAVLYKRILSDKDLDRYVFYRLEALLNLAGVYTATAKLDSAMAMTQTALTSLRQLPDYKKDIHYPFARMQLSRCAYLAGDLTTAIQEIEESYAVAKAIMPAHNYLITIGYVYTHVMGDVNDEKALEGTRTAKRILLSQPNYQKHPLYMSLLTNEVGMLRTLDRNKDAILVADSVFQRHSLDEMTELSGFGGFLVQANQAYIKARRDADSERIARKAQELLAIKGHRGADPYHLYKILGYYHQSKRNFSEAVHCLQEEMNHDGSTPGATYLTRSVRNRIAMCQAEAGQRTESFMSFSQLVHDYDQNAQANLWMMSEAERENYLNTSAISSLHWYLLRRPEPKPDEVELAYNYRLLHQGGRLKISRAINRFMHSYSRTDSVRSAVRQLIEARSQLAARPGHAESVDQSQLRQTIDSLERVMSSKAMVHQQMTKPVRWQDVRAELKPGEAAVEIVYFYHYSRIGHPVDSAGYAALLLRSDWATPKVVQLPVPDEDNALDSINLLRNNDYYIQVLHSASYQKRLFERFWKPIASALGSVKRVYIALDGNYTLLNLPTIRNPKTGRYLLDDLEIILVNSTQDILEKPRMSASRVANLIGYPDYFLNKNSVKTKPLVRRTRRMIKMRNGLTFEDLPFAKIEIEQLSQTLKAFALQPRICINAAASEAAFQQLQSPKILHVATHGYLRDTSRNASSQLLTCGLVLAGAADTSYTHSSSDGLLTGYEASLLNLHGTELVVLSACESGVGEYFEGEGRHGLQRAFRLAGAQSVLTSLWKVNDELTQQLMRDFYRYWLAGLSKPQALRRAQQNLRKQHPDPYYWGAFVLLGQ